MRQDDNELEHFPSQESLKLLVELIHRLSPNSLSIMEFNNLIDILIVEKISKHPFLGDKTDDTWKLELSREFDMTNDSNLFEGVQGSTSLPLYEGKMMHQFTHQRRGPRYWIDAGTGRKELIDKEIGRIEKNIYKLADEEAFFSIAHTRHARVMAFFQHLGIAPITDADVHIAPDAPRLAFRDIARNTDERTLIATILPPGVFAGNTLNYIKPWLFDAKKPWRDLLARKNVIYHLFPPVLQRTYVVYSIHSFWIIWFASRSQRMSICFTFINFLCRVLQKRVSISE
jgi:hypothetical protein